MRDTVYFTLPFFKGNAISLQELINGERVLLHPLTLSPRLLGS